MKLYICETMDGFIAKKDGSIDFLDQFNEQITQSNNQEIAQSFANFIKRIKNVVEGFTTYDQINKMGYGSAYKDYNHYVLTKSHLDKEDENVTDFISFDQLIDLKLNDEETFLIGGSQIITEAFKRQLISELIIFKLPIFLREGILLFNQIQTDAELKIVNICNDSNFYQVHYQVKYKN